jgi:ATP-dependent helicase IRC3
LQGFDSVVVDEAHHAPAPSYRALLEHVGAFKPRGPLLLGATATAYRGDGTGLDSVFEHVAYERTLLEMIREGWLCDLRAISVRLKADFNRLRTRAGDFVASDVDQLLRYANAPQLAVSAYFDHAPGRRALVFTASVAMAELMAEAFTAAGMDAAVVSGDTPQEERRAILQRFRDGKLRVLANASVLGEGYDEPSLDCVLIARPTKSRVRYAQMLGRGTRLWPGKRDCVVLDLVGATERHDLVTASSLFGLPLRDRESVRAAEVRVKAEAEAAQLATAERERLVAQAVDLFAAKQQERYWVRAPEGDCFVLSFGQVHGQVIVHGAGDAWGVIHTTGGYQAGYRDSVYAGALSLEMATGVAEDLARKFPAGMTAPDAAWWSQPASESQLRVVKWLGGKNAKVIPATKRESADAITLGFARRAIARVRRGGR